MWGLWERIDGRIDTFRPGGVQTLGEESIEESIILGLECVSFGGRIDGRIDILGLGMCGFEGKNRWKNRYFRPGDIQALGEESMEESIL